MSGERDEEGSRVLLRELVSDVRQWAEWNQVLGAEALPIEPPISRSPASAGQPSSEPTRVRAEAPPAAHPPSQPQTPERAEPPRNRPRFEPPSRASIPSTNPEESARGMAQGSLGPCGRCGAPTGREHQLFSVGPKRAELIVIGEAPDWNEDLKGEPFMGRSGQLLTRMLGAIGLRRDEIYICNVFKSSPPSDRGASSEPLCACSPPWVLQQFGPTNPRAVMTLGELASHRLLGLDGPMERMRGEAYEWEGLPVVASHHPAYLLSNPLAKREAWEDLRRVRTLLRR